MGIDYSQPLRLGFAFSHPADRAMELIEAYRKAGIPDEDIEPVDPGVQQEWVRNGWGMSIYARGSEEQCSQISALGFSFEMSHVLGPFKPAQP